MSIVISELSFSYEHKQVLDRVSFAAKDQELLSVLGPNGVGKTTLFRCLLGLLKGYRGQILLDGNDISYLGIAEMARLIAYIPQLHYPSFNYSVFDMVLMGTAVSVAPFSTPGRRQKELVEKALHRLGIAYLKERGFTQLSGGEQQLVLLARALVQESKILVLDEPTSNLDYGNQIRVLTVIKSLAAEGYTIIQSTHNPDLAFMFSDKVLALKDGAVLAYGTPAEIYTAELICELYGMEVRMESLYADQVRMCIPRIIADKVAANDFSQAVNQVRRKG